MNPYRKFLIKFTIKFLIKFLKLLEAFRDMPEAAWNIYEILNDDGSLTCLELAAQIGVSERMARKYISLLKANGLIVRIGSNKTGYWKTKR